DSPPEPDLSALTEFTVERHEPTRISQSRVAIGRNGKPQRHDLKGMTWSYDLTPKVAGDLVVPPPRVVVNGETLVGPSITLHVIAPRETPLAEFAVAVLRRGKYPLQPFTVTLKVFVKKLPEPYDGQDPLSAISVGHAPKLHVPWVDVPDGLKSEET